LAKFHGNIFSLSENIAKKILGGRGYFFESHCSSITVCVCADLTKSNRITLTVWRPNIISQSHNNEPFVTILTSPEMGCVEKYSFEKNQSDTVIAVYRWWYAGI